MQYRLIKTLRGQLGDIEAGELVNLEWDEDDATRCLIVSPNSRIRVQSRRLPQLIGGLEPVPTEEELSALVTDSVCPSVLGHEVESDGWDEEGSPSWLLALGLM